jgi:CRP-like cAMP-binding protein/HEAT repeat protein
VAGLLMFVLVKMFAPRYLAVLSLALTVVWLGVAFRLKRLYVRTLISAIEKRQIDFEGLAVDAHDPTMAAIIEKTLRSDDAAQRMFALELLEGLPLSAWGPTLREMFEKGSPEVKERILKLAADDASIVPDERVVGAIREDRRIALAAMQLAADRGIPNASEVIAGRLDDVDPEIKACAASAIVRLGQGPVERARTLLRTMVAAADPASRTAALHRVGADTELISGAEIAGLLNDGNTEVREAALDLVAVRGDETLLPAVIPALGEPRLALAARRALSAFDGDSVSTHLANHLNGRSNGSIRGGILRALGEVPRPAAIDILINQLADDELQASSVIANSLRRIGVRHPIPEPALARTKQHCETLVRRAYLCNRKMSLLPPGDRSTLLREHLDNEIQDTVSIVLRLKGLAMPAGAAEEMIMIVRAQETARLPYVMELLENTLDHRDRDLFAGLLEPLPAAQRDTIGARHYRDLPTDLMPDLAASIYSHRPWVSAIAVDYLNQSGKGEIIESIDWERIADQRLVREVLTPKNGRKTMYSTLEKTILLKSVSLFCEIPAEKLSHIAQVAEETHWPAESVILREGEAGDALFIVADGTVRVHKGALNLATLAKGDCLGEMAVLDQAPRSADATAIEDTTLLKISQEDFYEVLTANSEITERIVRLLTRRLREANAKLAAKASAAVS